MSYSIALPHYQNSLFDGLSLDCALMMEAGSGSQTAFASLVNRYRSELLNFFSKLGAYSDSEDLVQDTFVRLFRYRGRYQPTAKFATFLYTIARHVWIDRGRKVMRWERAVSKLHIEVLVDSQVSSRDQDRGIDVDGALNRLSPKLREVVQLHFYQGLRYQDIAARLGLPLGTVKSRINLAMKSIREVVSEAATAI